MTPSAPFTTPSKGLRVSGGAAPVPLLPFGVVAVILGPVVWVNLRG